MDALYVAAMLVSMFWAAKTASEAIVRPVDDLRRLLGVTLAPALFVVLGVELAVLPIPEFGVVYAARAATAAYFAWDVTDDLSRKRAMLRQVIDFLERDEVDP